MVLSIAQRRCSVADRRFVAVIGLLALVGAVAPSWWLAARVHAPARTATAAWTPPPAIVTAEVVRGPLTASIFTRGIVAAPGAVEVEADLLAGGSQPVVTATPFGVGDEIREGMVVLEVSGRPLILLQGELPMWRDLRPGMHGPDVEQLNKTLARLGFLGEVASADAYGPETAGAVGAMYASVGYRPVLIGEIDSAGVGTSLDLRGRSGSGEAVDDEAMVLLRSEIVVVPSPSAILLSLRYSRGEYVSGHLLTVASLRPIVEVHVAEDLVQGLEVGARSRFWSEAVPTVVHTGRIAEILPALTTDQKTGIIGRRVILQPDEPIPEHLFSGSVTVSVETASVPEALVVPMTAVSSDAAGDTYVLVATADGDLQRRPVHVELVADGLVAVSSPQLSELEQVVVSR
ncbi:MAG: hypothetical protein H8E59_07480 [Actinobacteria bacterium]|nr:hypothetical protein [Actinomycetota bacterium]